MVDYSKECRAKGMRNLLRLAEILDDADQMHRDDGEPKYDQSNYIHPCGTPACAMGHYALATEADFRISPYGAGWWFTNRSDGRILLIDDFAKSEFCLEDHESWELFSGSGCGNAKTAKQAAAYIRRFVDRKCPMPPPMDGGDANVAA